MHNSTRYRALLVGFSLLLCLSFTPKDKWVTLEYKQHGFKIDFPSRPLETKDILRDEQLKNPEIYYYTYEPSPMLHDPNASYNVCVTNYPPLSAEMEKEEFRERFYNSLIQDVFNKDDNRLIAQKKIKIGKYSGVEGIADNEQGKNIITVRIFLLNNKLIQLSTLTSAANKSNKKVAQFLNSFKLLQ